MQTSNINHVESLYIFFSHKNGLKTQSVAASVIRLK